MERKIVLIGSDTTHRHYLINRLLDAGIPLAGCLFETVACKPPYATGPTFEAQEDAYMKEHFFVDTPYELDRVQVHRFDSANTEAARAYLRDLKPDFAIISGAGRLQPAVLDLFPDGLINVHLGIAEEYRGLDSNLWAVFHRDYANMGVTIHYADADLDTGPIVETRQLALQPGMECHMLRYHESLVAADMMIRASRQYLEGTLSAREQTKRGRYYSFIPRDLKTFAGSRLNTYCQSL